MLSRWAGECTRLLAVVALLASVQVAAASAGSRVASGLLTQHGTPFAERDIAGVPTAIFFGFTHCPDICPGTLMELTNDLEALGADGDSHQDRFRLDRSRAGHAGHLEKYMSELLR
jgi:protein SCO1/2